MALNCPSCLNKATLVLDTRPLDDGNVIRRKRRCRICDYKFESEEVARDVRLVAKASLEKAAILQIAETLASIAKA